MRRPADFPARRAGIGGRGRVVLVVVAIALFILITSMRGIARFYTDYLWFDSLGLSGVWSGVLGAKILLAVLFSAIFFVAAFVNLWVADRLAPRFRPAGPEEDVLMRYREFVGTRIGLVRIAVALLFALIAGVGVSREWNSWILFRNSVDFGIEDPQFHTDVGFYVFRLPFLSFVVDWAFAALVVIVIITAVAHYLNGGIRFQVAGQRVTPQVKGHLSVLLGLLALLRTVDYWLQRFELNFSSRGVVDGASYTDVKAQLPALHLLVFISIAAAILFLVNIRMRGWVLPVIAVGLWAFVSLIAGTIYPSFIQRFRVEPAESSKEAPYIERNIEATRVAMGLDDVETRDFDYDTDLNAKDLRDNSETIRNIRLWRPTLTQQIYERLQEVRSFYRFNDVDVDRYDLDGRRTQVMLSVRELNPTDLPSRSWENRVLAYTHGYGAVMSPANAVTAEGSPAFRLRDVPPRGTPEVEQPAVYYGESLPGYAVVGTERDEIDYPTATGLAESRFNGSGGVRLSSFIRQAAFALRFGDANPLISNLVNDDSRILFLRDVRDRVEAAAPFLHYDGDPYPVIIGGRIHWVIDAFTTTDDFPYAQRADVSRLDPDKSGLIHGFNYIRNSVKAVIDAYDGSLSFYIVDPDDPIAEAYRKAFPELFSTLDAAPEELIAHFRYPEDLFRVQTQMFGRYHIDDAAAFYSQSDSWDIAQDPTTGTIQEADVRTSTSGTLPDGTTARLQEQRMEPYYLLMRLPGQTKEDFLILQPMVPVSSDDSRKELSAFMIAKSDPEEYGKLEVFVMPRDQQVPGPAIVDGEILATQEVSELVTLLGGTGSRIEQGNLLVVPIEESLLYVRPLYVRAEGSTQVPKLEKVVVWYNGRVEVRDTLAQALEGLFGSAPPTLEEPGGDGGDGGGEEPTTTSADVLRRAADLFDEAERLRKAGDFVGYLRKIDEARHLIEANQVDIPSATTTTTTTPAAA